MDAGFLNILALLFGLMGLGLPVAALVLGRGGRAGAGARCSLLGFASATLCLLMVIFYNDHLVALEDWSALLDTSAAFRDIAAAYALAALVLGGVGFEAAVKPLLKSTKTQKGAKL